MVKFLLIGLMAASALVPASAMAQERAERPRREASDGNRPQREFQRQRLERRMQQAPQAPQRDYQNQRPQMQGRAPERDFQRIRPEQGERRERPEGWARPGTTRPDARPDRPDSRPDRSDRGTWQNRSERPDWRNREDRDARRGWNDRNDWRDRDSNRDWREREQRRRAAADRSWRDDTRQRQAWNDRRAWSRSWRTDRRYDWNGYRQANRHLYRLPRYYPPSGYNYGYQRFSIGLTLGSMLYRSSYWINDPYSYRLPPADGPFRWVRYYNDALLVDLQSGEVVDVVYDLFW